MEQRLIPEQLKLIFGSLFRCFDWELVQKTKKMTFFQVLGNSFFDLDFHEQQNGPHHSFQLIFPFLKTLKIKDLQRTLN